MAVAANDKPECVRTFDWKWCEEFLDDERFAVAYEDGVSSWPIRQFMANMNNLVLRWGDKGIFLVKDIDDGIGEVHTFFKDTSDFKDAADSSFAYTFCAVDFNMLVTPIPEFNRPAKVAAKRVGFKLSDAEPGSFMQGGKPYKLEYYALNALDWALKSKTNKKIGKRFHTKLHEKLGYVNHPDDDNNDALVGFVARAIKYGNLERLGIYNAWAEEAGYYQLVIYNMVPPVIDIGDGLIAIRGDDFEVI